MNEVAWMLDGKSIYYDDQVIKLIEDGTPKIVFLDGPSMCGKTSLIKRVDPAKIKIVKSDKIAEIIMEYLEEKQVSDEIKDADIVYFDDVDMTLCGKPVTQEEFTNFIVNKLSRKTVVLIGISLRERLKGMFRRNSLEMVGYSYFEYCEN